MTPEIVIERADYLRPNAYDYLTKLNWVFQAEALVLARTGAGEGGIVPYEQSHSDPDRPLSVSAPFDQLYLLYVLAQMDLFDQNYGAYNNSAALFNDTLLGYCRCRLRHQAPACAGGFRL